MSRTDRLGALAERVTRDLVEASESGWFKDKGQQATYVELFRRAQEALRADDPEAAIVAMGRVESLVRSARQADELSQEIYALVFFNARFLERSIMLPIITRTEQSR